MKRMINTQEFIDRIQGFRKSTGVTPNTQDELFTVLKDNMLLLLQATAMSDEGNDFSRNIISIYLDSAYQSISEEITPEDVMLKGKKFVAGGIRVYNKDRYQYIFWNQLKERVNRCGMEDFSRSDICFIMKETQTKEMLHPAVIRQYFNALIIDPIVEYMKRIGVSYVIQFNDVVFKYLTIDCFNDMIVSRDINVINAVKEQMATNMTKNAKMFSSERLKLITGVGKSMKADCI